MNFETILVATDFSDHSAAAMAAAADLARHFRSRLHVVHAFDLPVPFVPPYEVAVPVPYLDEARAEAGRELEASARKLRADGLDVETHLSEVPAATAITRIAGEVGADLIVLGTRGRSGVSRLLLGSVAERTLRMAPCAVLTVKAPGAD